MKSLTKKIVLVFVLIFLMAACSAAPEAAQDAILPQDQAEAVDVDAAAADEPISLIVSGGPVQCVGVAADCLQVKYNQDAEWETLQGQIEGFEAEPGYDFLVVVEAAGGGNLYKLVEVREKNEMTQVGGDDLAGKYWVLSGFGGLAQPDSVREGAQISFQFDPATNQVSGRSGCNNYFGEVTVDYARMTFTVAPMGMSRMACAEDVMAQESAYLEMLGRAVSFAVEEESLFLFTDADEVMVFAPGEPSSGR